MTKVRIRTVSRSSGPDPELHFDIPTVTTSGDASSRIPNDLDSILRSRSSCQLGPFVRGFLGHKLFYFVKPVQGDVSLQQPQQAQSLEYASTRHC